MRPTDAVGALDLDRIQGTILRERPLPYFGSYLLYEVGDAAEGRAMLRRLLPHVTTAAGWEHPDGDAWLNVVLTHPGLARIGLPQEILDGFPRELREPMRTRKAFLGDIGESDPAHWDLPEHGSFDIGVLLMAPDETAFAEKLAIGHGAQEDLPSVRRVSRLDIRTPDNLREHFGYADGISRPYIEGQGGTPRRGQSLAKPGEFVLGYVNELGRTATGPGPEALWRNGTYLSIRKLHQKVAEFRRFLTARSEDEYGAELLAAKMAGRWRSGCPLALSPEKDVTVEPERLNDFAYYDDDPRGLRTPIASHIRRVNPRDALKDTIVDVRLHQLLRRGAAYGPMLPEGVLEDDGVDRGVVLAFANADPARQFEFVQSQWVNDGDFISAGADQDPLAGNHVTEADFSYAAKPVRRRLRGLPAFVVTKGGEHVFLPGVNGLRYLADGRW
ncbi:Dyp-type peroxidase [Streptomyces arenae]|uniref:Dyp-type peroxidase n=1 Tax=Streptomyces arenae TaxID=29301 RepID=UPI002657F6D4|nr:peroxidase [Streptomyces arenae]MCG7210856.1 peroxidase [Streptomyces arenae]